jgi:hypothetical protein
VKDWSRRELLSSAVCAGIGLMFAHAALFGEQRYTSYEALDRLGCALVFFSIALAPGRLFVSLKGLRKAPGSGLLVWLSLLAAAVFVLAGVLWLLAPGR